METSTARVFDALRPQFVIPLSVYLLTTSIVWLGVSVGQEFFSSRRAERALLESIHRADAVHYSQIVLSGYEYDPGTRSLVAFFPVYPLLAKGVALLMSVSPIVALTITSNVLLATSFVAFHRYLITRPESGPAPSPDHALGGAFHESETRCRLIANYALLSFGLLPATFFFRMPYSEAAFLLVAILSLYGMEHRWPVPLLVLLVGLGTATRPVGLALVPCFMIYVFADSSRTREALLRGTMWLPFACWGLLAYMTYQYLTFGDALAFAKTQEFWRVAPLGTWLDKMHCLGSLEPVWGTYLPSSPYSWQTAREQLPALFSLLFVNPLYFVCGSILVIIGSRYGWLTQREIVLSCGLILIPYVTRGYEWGMFSQARFMAAVFPIYIVLGHLLSRLPPCVSQSGLALGGFFLGVYAGCFAAGMPLF